MISIQDTTAYDFSGRSWQPRKINKTSALMLVCTTITISHETKWVKFTSKAKPQALVFLFCRLPILPNPSSRGQCVFI